MAQKEFDDANRLATKYYKGNEFAKAAQYFTKCINMLDEIPVRFRQNHGVAGIGLTEVLQTGICVEASNVVQQS